MGMTGGRKHDLGGHRRHISNCVIKIGVLGLDGGRKWFRILVLVVVVGVVNVTLWFLRHVLYRRLGNYVQYLVVVHI